MEESTATLVVFFILFGVIVWLMKKIKFENVLRLSDIVSIIAIIVTAFLTLSTLYMNVEIASSQLTLETKTQDTAYLYSNNTDTLRSENHTIMPLEDQLEIELVTGNLNMVYGVTNEGNLDSIATFDFDEEQRYRIDVNLIKDYTFLLFTGNNNSVFVDKIISHNNNFYVIDHNNVISKEYVQNFNDKIGTNLDFEKINEGISEIKQNYRSLTEQ